MRMSAWLRKAVHLGVIPLAMFLMTLPAILAESVNFARWEAGQCESVCEPAEPQPGKWTQEADCLRAGRKEAGVLNFLHCSTEAADVTVEWASDATGRRRFGRGRRVRIAVLSQRHEIVALGSRARNSNERSR